MAKPEARPVPTRANTLERITVHPSFAGLWPGSIGMNARDGCTVTGNRVVDSDFGVEIHPTPQSSHSLVELAGIRVGRECPADAA